MSPDLAITSDSRQYVECYTMLEQAGHLKMPMYHGSARDECMKEMLAEMC